MKKSIVTSLVMLLAVAGVASANTIVVPFFNDSAAPPPPYDADLAAFVQVKNVSSDSVVVMLEYGDENGLDGTPGENTFELIAGQAIGWRPVQADEALEGPNGVLVPDAAPVGTLALGRGGVTIHATGPIMGAGAQWNYFRNGAASAIPALEIPE